MPYISLNTTLMKYFIIIIFMLVYAFCGAELGYSAYSPWWTHITYSFQHQNIWHLALNSVAFVGLYGVITRFVHPCKLVAFALAVAVAASFVCAYPKVVMGASGMIYAFLGIYVALLFRRKLRFRCRSDLWLFIISMLSFLFISAIKSNSATLLHLVCLFAGIAGGVLYFRFTPKK